MASVPVGAGRQVQHYLAKDGRLIGLLVPGDFTDFTSFRPFVNTEEERRHLAEAYRVESAEREAATKAHLTDDELPLQITVLARDPGGKVNPHYHVNDRAAKSPTRHQIMLCQSGRARIGLFTTEGEHVDTVIIGPHDLILMTEGHSIETLDPGTRLVEIKMGPFPETDQADKVDLHIPPE
ncbi:MAG TPA: hypothetical protein VKB51_02085 [bacterium]|nr:hypothetical protein [bacterium]